MPLIAHPPHSTILRTVISALMVLSLLTSGIFADETAETAPVIVMLGDSTTDQGLPWVVLKQLDQRIPSPLGRKNMINAGKGGDNATAALERLDKDVLAHQPDIVTVSFGLNDTGGRKPAQYGESVKTIVQRLKAADITVILMTSTPFNNDRHFWAEQEEFQKLGGLDEYMNREFCERMRTIAREENVLLCDLHQIFKKEFAKDPEAINTLISKDGVHLTGDGLDLMARHIVPILQKLLAQRNVEESGSPDKHGLLDLSKAPYFADPTGKRDSTEAIRRALDDVTELTREAFQRTLLEMEALPTEGVHHHPASAENHRENGTVHCSTSLDLPHLPVLYFPEGTYLVSDTLRHRPEGLTNTYGSEMNQQVRIRGAGVGRTTIRLQDEAAGFGAGSAPAAPPAE